LHAWTDILHNTITKTSRHANVLCSMQMLDFAIKLKQTDKRLIFHTFDFVVLFQIYIGVK
jgi:hypothetical protein